MGIQLKKEGVVFNEVHTSTALRTQQTASLVLDPLEYKGTVAITPAILEQSGGGWEGQSRLIYQRNDVKRNLDIDNWNYVPGGDKPGESQHTTAERMTNWSQQQINNYSKCSGTWNIGVFTHGLAIKLMIAKLFDLYRPLAYKIPTDNTSVTVLHFVNGVFAPSAENTTALRFQDGKLITSTNDMYDMEMIIPLQRFNDISHYSLI